MCLTCAPGRYRTYWKEMLQVKLQGKRKVMEPIEKINGSEEGVHAVGQSGWHQSMTPV